MSEFTRFLRKILLRLSLQLYLAGQIPAPQWGILAGSILIVLCAFLPGFGTDLKWHWASSGLLALGGCILASRLSRPWILPGLLIWFAGLGTTTLLAQWHSGLSDGFTLAGLFPYSDAAGYFGDAQRILVGESITSFSSRRPLYAAFLAGLLKITGNNLRWTLWLQTLLVSSTIGCVIWTVWKRTEQVPSTAIFGMIMWVFARRFIGTTTTENLGFLLGALGFMALWEAFQERSPRLFALGLFLTGLALNARAGAFFVLPALLLWGALYLSKNGRCFSRQALGLGGAALVLAFAVNYGVLALSGGQPGLAFSNFSYTLYGLVHGGNWQLALAQHPELISLESGPQANSVFHLALRRIEGHPLSLVLGALKAWISFLPRAFLFVDSPHPWAPSALVSRLLALLALRGLYVVWKSRSKAIPRLMIAYFIGIFLSVPFAPPWDSDYMRIYAATIPALCWLASIGVQTESWGGADPSPSPSPSIFKAILLASVCVLLVLILPHTRRDAPETENLEVIPGSLLRVASWPSQLDSPSPSPANGIRRTWMMLLREQKLPPIPLDQLLENAHPRITPEGIRTFLNSLPQESLTIALARGKTWRALPGHSTNLIVIQGTSAWAFDARGPQTLGPIPLPPMPRDH